MKKAPPPSATDTKKRLANTGAMSIASFVTLRQSRVSFMSAFTNSIILAIESRKKLKVYHTFDNESLDVTPAFIHYRDEQPNFAELKQLVALYFKSSIPREISSVWQDSVSSTMLSHSSARIRGIRMSMDDVLNEIGSNRLLSLFKPRLLDAASSESFIQESPRFELPFIKVKLRYTDEIFLYEAASTTAMRGTKEATIVENDNIRYDYMTIGKGKVRRRSEAEAQTNDVLYKSRGVNTIVAQIADAGTYVSNYEMFDTYEELKKQRVKDHLDDENISGSIENQLEMIANSKKFKLASMIIKRFLSGNEHESGQRRFRNMNTAHRLMGQIDYIYRPYIMFRFHSQSLDKERKAVADISFCSKNGDIVAVAYGIYSFTAMHVPSTGYVCVWNIKNPGDPERSYYYNEPVASVAFSPFIPNLLAIGLYDGMVEVRDITEPDSPPVAISQRDNMASCDPITAIQWIKHDDAAEVSDVEPFLCLSQDGSVIKYRIINSPYLQSFTQMVLQRVEGTPEGLVVKRANVIQQQANRHPQGLQLVMHPIYSDVYYVLTDEGCMHKCSTNYQHQYLEIWKTHDGSVNCMDFSPWSPKLFVTAGNDWCARIWIDGLFKPLITLKSAFLPVHCAYWSRVHSTIILTLTRKSFDIWDIRRSTLKPMSSTQLDTSFYTLAKPTLCGRSIAIGNQRGNVLMCALDDMPFEPHFQYDELEKAIFNAISLSPDLIIELKSIGFFGYPDKRAGGI